MGIMGDVLFYKVNLTFSFRASGILIINGKVLLQAPKIPMHALSLADMLH